MRTLFCSRRVLGSARPTLTAYRFIIRVGFTTEQEVLTSLICHQGPRLSETSTRPSPSGLYWGTRQRHFVLILRGDKNACDGVIDHQ